jgi:hypothetical protein
VLDGDEAAFLQAANAFAGDPAADAELRREVGLPRKGGSGLQRAARDVRDEHPHEVLVEARHTVIESPGSSRSQTTS